MRLSLNKVGMKKFVGKGVNQFVGEFDRGSKSGICAETNLVFGAGLGEEMRCWRLAEALNGSAPLEAEAVKKC
jgi:hypothetical protein